MKLLFEDFYVECASCQREVIIDAPYEFVGLLAVADGKKWNRMHECEDEAMEPHADHKFELLVEFQCFSYRLGWSEGVFFGESREEVAVIGPEIRGVERVIEENNLVPGSPEESDDFLDIFKLTWEVSGTEWESDFWALLGQELRDLGIIEEDGIEEEGALDADPLENLATFSVTHTHECFFSFKKREDIGFVFSLDIDSERPVDNRFSKKFYYPHTQTPLEEECIKWLSFLIVIDDSSTPDDNLVGFGYGEEGFDECENIRDRSRANVIREITDIFDAWICGEEGSLSVVGENRESRILVTVAQIFILLQEYELVSEIVGAGGGEYGEMHRTLSYC